jgi:hypothetical protein
MATVTEVVSAWGKYINHGQNKKDILSMFRDKSATDEVLTMIPTENDVLRKSTVSVSRVLQRFQKAYTALGAVEFLPFEIPLDRLKIDFSETPDDIVQSWLAFLSDRGLDRKDWPLMKFLPYHIIEQSREDWELLEVYKGVQAAIVPGTASASGASVNGIKKQINDHITAGRIPATISTGAPSTTPATWAGQVEDFFEAIPEKYWPHISSINMSPSLRTRFKKGNRAKYNVNYEQKDSLLTLMDHENVEIKGLPSMTGSTKIWCTVKGNAVCGIKTPTQEGVFQVQEIKREVVLMTDWWKGVGFFVPQWIFTNDQDL